MSQRQHSNNMKQESRSKNQEARIKYLKISLLISIVLTSLYLLLYTAVASAQTENLRVITIVPPAKEHSLNPGERAEGILKVINDSDEVLTFRATIRDYIVEDNKGTPRILPPDTLTNKYSAASWIGVFPPSFTVAPHQKQELNYYLQVPADAKPGGHYAAVLYEPAEVIGVEGTGTGVTTHIGTLFYIHVKGDIKEDARVLRFEAKGFQEYGPVLLSTEILNNGDLHIRPKGTITVRNIFGQAVATKALEEHNIFPEKTFLFENKVGSKWMIGRYTARFVGTYGLANNLPLMATVSFIVFPWKVVAIGTLLVVAAILAIIAIKRKRRKHHEAKNEEPESSPRDHPVL